MSNYIEIENKKGLVRDLNSKAILNTDQSLLERHKMRMMERKKLQELNSDVVSLKQEIVELKNLMKQLVTTHG